MNKAPIAIALFAAGTAVAAVSGQGQPASDAGGVVMLNVTRPPVVQTYDLAAADMSGPTGRVTFNFCVDEQGRTRDIKIVHSQPPGVFDKGALQLMRAAEFQPHVINGQPVKACGITQTIVFRPAH